MSATHLLATLEKSYLHQRLLHPTEPVAQPLKSPHCLLCVCDNSNAVEHFQRVQIKLQFQIRYSKNDDELAIFDLQKFGMSLKKVSRKELKNDNS